IAYSPLAQGILSGKYRTGAVQMSLSRRLLSGSRVSQQQKLEPLFLVLEDIAYAHGKTIAQVALNWLVNKDGCIIPIPGAKNARQASENAGALGWRLTEEEHARISQVASR
ncbi:MAG TPA: aldo/keto reductase, partial [Ktedonobacteraceae bacterium]|nr:aldo/keto reductase [Ktedonobacteraceae bacterium]